MLTQTEIAKRLGVSQKTVSRVINESSRVKGETRDRVLSILREAGYSVNVNARNLSTGRTGCVSVLLSGSQVFESIYFLQTFRGINAVLSERHYHLFFSVPETVREVESVLAKSDGVIVFGIHGEDRMNSIFEGGFRTSARFPRVFIKSRDRGERPLVTIDNREGGRVAASHLLDLGHRRIAYLGAGEGDDEGGRRIMGGREAVLERGSPGVFHLYSYGRSDMEATMERFFNERELRGITAVFCWSDRDARVLVYECRLRGIRVPEDLSVIGFDDRPAYTTMVHPYLTTVRQPFDDLGKVAAEQIFRLMENGNAEPQEWDECVQIKPKLVARETCSPPS